MVARKDTPSVDTVNVDDLFTDFPPTIVVAPFAPLVCTFEALRKTEVEIDGRMQDAFIAEVTTISGQEIDRVTGVISDVTAGEARSWWIFGTVVREEFKVGRPSKGERIVILDRGLKLKRDAVKAGKTLETADPKGDTYHDTHVAFPDRPQAVAESVSFDEL